MQLKCPSFSRLNRRTVSRITWVFRSSSKMARRSCSHKVKLAKEISTPFFSADKKDLVWIREFSLNVDYINGVLYELENGDTSKPSSKEDWDSAITFTARTSGKNSLSLLHFFYLFRSFQRSFWLRRVVDRKRPAKFWNYPLILAPILLRN